jgi:hypothetical protein
MSVNSDHYRSNPAFPQDLGLANHVAFQKYSYNLNSWQVTAAKC